MNFLRNHFEKLILGSVLIALLASIALLLHSLGRAGTGASALIGEARAAATGGGPIKLIGEEDFRDAYQTLADQRVRFETLAVQQASPLQGNLYDPPDYILCYSETCNRLIPITADKCPFCGTEQPPRNAAPRPEDDLDNDGLPNFVEKKYPFLHPENPYDARQDEDGDGFLNAEEFRAGTDMQNPESRPPLAANLRFERVFQRPLPVMLKRISRNNSDDPARWTITMQSWDAPRNRWRTKLSSVGKEIEGYVIQSARFVDNPAQEGKQIGVVEVKPPDGSDPYTLREGETASERERFAVLYYYLSRYVQYARSGGVRRLLHKVGDEIGLTWGRPPNLQTEVYRLESISPDTAEVLLIKPPPAAGLGPTRLTVPKINPREDFIPQMPAGARSTMEEGGYPGGSEDSSPPMMTPSPYRRPRPGGMAAP
ncbi:MAG: hypothetical protein JXR77_00325 [Lentisphaeria bacterium]|nr:hypothetical protein [Lentisphaeria bacterium]